MNKETLVQSINQVWDESIIPCLCDYIKIPNKSPDFDANWQEHGFMEQAAELIFNWCVEHGPKEMKSEIVRLPNRTPLLFFDIPGNSDETVLLYGHLDKQPEMEGWRDGLSPWQPVLEDGKLYGRGGADDGYAAFASIAAIKALKEQKIPHNRIVLIIEASEESGSVDLPVYIQALKEKIGEPSLVICLDSGAGNYDQLWMTTSLRGNIVGELSVSLIKEGVHSGNASGIVADSFRIARNLLSRIEDEKTGEVLLSELKTIIPEQRIKQAEFCAEVLGDEVFSAFPFQEGVQPVNTNRQELVLNRTWRAALSVTGADGLPSIENAGNVSRPLTKLKLSMRTPPICDLEKATRALHATLTETPPLNAKVEFKSDEGASGWNAPVLSQWLEKSCNDASNDYFGRDAVYMGEGGTIPFMGMLADKFPKAEFMVTGVLGPNSNAHGPNEFLHIDMAKKLTACVASVIKDKFEQQE